MSVVMRNLPLASVTKTARQNQSEALFPPEYTPSEFAYKYQEVTNQINPYPFYSFTCHKSSLTFEIPFAHFES